VTHSAGHDADGLARRRVGHTEVALTELGFGTSRLGNLYAATDDDTADAAVDAAWAAGIRYFDTAPHYGLGLAEHRLGKALADRPRDEFVVSTKVGRLLEPNPRPTGSDLAAGGFDVPDDLVRRFDYSRDGVRRSLEASLERLGLDRVDVVLVHDPDDFVDEAIRSAVPALVGLRDEGVVAAVGVGMNQWEAPLRFVRETDVDVVMLAGRWTLLDRTGAPLLEACAERGVSVLDAGPFNSGVLATPWPEEGAPFDYTPADTVVLARARDLATTCRRHDLALPAAALRFALRSEVVASVVAGMGTADEVRSNVEWLGTDVPEAVWEELEPPAPGTSRP
jgi:D-threo-aldose 1-dehydrogenase